MNITRPPRQTITTGLVVAIVGFFSSFAIILQGLISVGATNAQAASGLMAAAVFMGLTGIGLSLWKREPISAVWPTPSIAFLAAAGPVEGGLSVVVGAFVFAGALTLIAGIWRPLGRLAASIPPPLAQAMLGGVLLSLCIVPFKAMFDVPAVALPIVLTWFVVGRFNRVFAVPAAVLAALAVVLLSAGFELPAAQVWVPTPVWIMPAFSLAAVVSLGLPLFVIAMATQNIPGIAILRSFGYAPAPGALFATLGIASIVSAPLAGPGTCLAAITAAMCANDESFPDPKLRYWTAVFAGIFYCVLGLLAGLITAFAALAPEFTVASLAGVALFGVFANSTLAALKAPGYLESASVTFLVTASGASLFGLGGAVSGLVVGGLVHLFMFERGGRTG